MKKLSIYFVTLAVLFSCLPNSVTAGAAVPATTPATTPGEAAEAKTLLLRLNEINETDKTSMSAKEKKELRREVKSIKSRLRAIGGGVYVSVGALIIIILLLIILL